MSSSEAERFKVLQKQLPKVWRQFQEELARVTGAAFYEERFMFALIRLRNPNARLIYVTSQPVVDYSLKLLDSVAASHARKRLHMVSVFDSSPRPRPVFPAAAV